jgi:putative transposase
LLRIKPSSCRVVSILTGEVVSPQTVSRLTRELDEAVRQFHQAPLEDDWAYLFLDGVSLRVRRPCGRQRVQMLLAYGVRGDGTRQLLGFMRSKGESQSAWEGLLQDLYRRGLRGEKLLLIVTDGCPGLAAAIETVYPRALHQRCWVHKMRNILEKVRRRDYDEVKQGAQAIYGADSRRQAEAAFRAFRRRWQAVYGPMVRQMERDLPELLSFFSFPRHRWKKLRTTNIIERCFVEVRRRTRPMVCFVNLKSVDRILYSIFQRFNLEWKTRTLRVFTQAAWRHQPCVHRELDQFGRPPLRQRFRRCVNLSSHQAAVPERSDGARLIWVATSSAIPDARPSNPRAPAR